MTDGPTSPAHHLSARALTFIKHADVQRAHDEKITYPETPSMTHTLTDPFKAQLLARRTGLLEQLAQLRGGAVSRTEASADHFGRPEDPGAQTATERELEFALDAHESAELDAVDAALKRMEAGSYGQCVDCGITIPAARLHAAPEAARCITCQEKTE